MKLRLLCIFAFLWVAHAHVRQVYQGLSIRNANAPAANGAASVAGPCGGINVFGKNGINPVNAGQTVTVGIQYAAGHAAAANVFRLAYLCGKPGNQTLLAGPDAKTDVPTQPEPKADVTVVHKFQFTIPPKGAAVDAQFCTISLLDQRNWGGCVDLEIVDGVIKPTAAARPTVKPKPTAAARPTVKPKPTAAAKPTAKPVPTAAKPTTASKPTARPTLRPTPPTPQLVPEPTFAPPVNGKPSALDMRGRCQDVNQIMDCSGNCWNSSTTFNDLIKVIGNGICNDYDKIWSIDYNCRRFNCDGGDCKTECFEGITIPTLAEKSDADLKLGVQTLDVYSLPPNRAPSVAPAPTVAGAPTNKDVENGAGRPALALSCLAAMTLSLALFA